MVENSGTQVFLREILKNCIGTTMIEPNSWNFPDDFPEIKRGYFSDRLKKTKCINSKTALQLMQLFSYLLTSQELTGKYQEPQAIKASNELLGIFNKWFDIDVSLWHNKHEDDNSASRYHILLCLENILNMCIDTDTVPIKKISGFLNSYLEKIADDDRISEFPTIHGCEIYGQTECYIGREEFSEHIVELILNNEKCYLHGIGGIGKTEVAKDVLKKIHSIPSSKSRVTHILWVNYIENNFAISLVKALGQSDVQLNKAYENAINEINSYGDHLLLIVDNVEDPKDDRLFSLANYLNCKMLITSRCDGYKSLKRIPVPSLDKDYCKELFEYYYTIERNDDFIYKIIALADYHTVTIELLAKIADTEEVPLNKFYQTLIECGFRIGSENVVTAHEKLHDEDQVIEQLIKLFRVYDCSEDERNLLIQASTIPNIPFLFTQAQRWFGISHRMDINHLADRGWIKKESLYTNGRNRYRYIMHSVIASAVRAQFMDKLYDLCQGFIYEITLDMKKCVNENDDFKKGLIQFSWSLNDIFNGDFHSETDAEFLWALSEIYRDIGFYTRAIRILDRLLAVYENLYGHDCIQQCSVWNNKGMMEYELSHFNDALLYYEKCDSIQKAHTLTASAQRINHAKLKLNIGKIHLKNDYKDAITYFDDAYAILKEELGEDACDTLNALTHKAIIKKYQGEPQETERIFLEILKKIDGIDDRDFLLLKATLAHNLGDLYSDYAPNKAMDFFVIARDIFSKLFSPTHPDTVDVLNTICSFRSSHGENSEQLLSDMEELLSLYEEIYGHYDPNVAVEYVNIGLCLANMDESEQAIEHYEEAIRIYMVVYDGEVNPEFAYIYTNIGAVYCQTENFDAAIEQDLIAIGILEKAYPDKRNLDLAMAYSDIADAYFAVNDYKATEKYLNYAFDILDNMVEWDSRYYYLPYSTLANLFEISKQYDDAEKIYLQLVEVMLANEYTEDSPTIAQFREKAAELHQLAHTT